VGPAAKDAVPALAEALQCEDYWDLQWAASDALCAIGVEAKAAIPTLVSALKRPATAQWASKVLGRIGPAAVPALIDGLRAGEAQTCEWAADALGQIGQSASPAVPHLHELLHHEKQSIRWWAAIALASIAASPAATPILFEAIQAEHEDDVRARAAESM